MTMEHQIKVSKGILQSEATPDVLSNTHRVDPREHQGQWPPRLHALHGIVWGSNCNMCRACGMRRFDFFPWKRCDEFDTLLIPCLRRKFFNGIGSLRPSRPGCSVPGMVAVPWCTGACAHGDGLSNSPELMLAPCR